MGDPLDVTRGAGRDGSEDRSKHDRMYLALRASKLGIWDVDLKTGAVYWSDRVKEIFGIAPDVADLHLETLFNLTHRADQERVRARMDQHFREKTPYEIEYRVVRARDGEVRWIYCIGDSIWEADGVPLRSLGSVYDITDRKLAEEQLIKSEERARQADAARIAAEAVNEARNRFLANTSHQLRTPLNAIINYSELMLETAQSERREQDAADHGRILAASRNLARLIDDLLDLAKIEAGTFVVSSSDYDVRRLLAETVDLVRPIVERNRNVLELEVDHHLSEGRSDPVRLGQCVFNLLSNAAKFTSDGLIKVRARPEIRAGVEWLEIAVADTGVGIADERKAFLFEPLMQADGSGQNRGSGSGLGLAVTRQLAGSLGGSVEMESEVGKGSCFTLRVPLGCASLIEQDFA